MNVVSVTPSIASDPRPARMASDTLSGRSRPIRLSDVPTSRGWSPLASTSCPTLSMAHDVARDPTASRGLDTGRWQMHVILLEQRVVDGRWLVPA